MEKFQDEIINSCPPETRRARIIKKSFGHSQNIRDAVYFPSSHSSTTTKMSLNQIDAAMASPLPQIIAAGTKSIGVVSDSIRSAVDYGGSSSAEDGAEDDYYDDDPEASAPAVAAIAGWMVAVNCNPFVGTCVDVSDMSAHSLFSLVAGHHAPPTQIRQNHAGFPPELTAERWCGVDFNAETQSGRGRESKQSRQHGLRTPPTVVGGRMTRTGLASGRGYRPLDLVSNLHYADICNYRCRFCHSHFSKILLAWSDMEH